MTRFSPLWQQAGSYAATLDRNLIAALWPLGGATGAVPTAVTNTMNVSMAAPGAVVVPLQAGQGCALCQFDAAEVVTLTAAPASGQSRIDLVVAQVRDNALDAGPNNDWIFSVVTGVAAATGSQVAPATPTNAYVVARVLVPGAVANLNTATVTDMRANGLIAGPWTVAGTIAADYTTTASLGTFLTTASLEVGVWEVTLTALVSASGAGSNPCGMVIQPGTAAATFQGPTVMELRNDNATSQALCASLTTVVTITTAGTLIFQAIGVGTVKPIIKATPISGGVSGNPTGYVAKRRA